jgi:hypothetical protein
MVVDGAFGILFALEILFIGLPVAIWLIGGVLAREGGTFKPAVQDDAQVSAPEER